MDKIEKEIKVTRYVAFDGTEFETEAECRHYEGSAFALLLQQLKSCCFGGYFSPEGHRCYCLLPKTRHDVFVLSQILALADKKKSCADVYEKLTLLTVHFECNTVAYAEVTNLEDYIADISNGQFCIVSTIKKTEMK